MLRSVLVVLILAVGCADEEPAPGLQPGLDVTGDVVTSDVAGDEVAAPDVVMDIGGEDVAEPDEVASDDLVEPDAVEDVDEPDPGPPPQICPPGLVGCAEGEMLVCNEDGTSFESVPCEEGLLCNDGECVACVADADCDGPERCVEGSCEVPGLLVVTESVPGALLNVPYLVPLIAAGGAPPYTWSEVDPESWPVGVVVGEDGGFGGVPQEAGEWELTVEVSDSVGQTAQATFSFEVSAADLAITTPSPLPVAVEGEPYSVSFAADGGVEPYFFGSLDPLPAGLVLTPSGALSGVPATDETGTFTLKVFDNGSPTLSASKTFELPIELAPLDIIGEQEVDLFVTKLITLPLIVIVQGIPVPYEAQLQAKGGKKPYAWSEEPLSDAVKNLVPNAGLPSGLSLAANGAITGAVTDPSLVVELQIPFTQIVLKGFLFTARVADSQDPAESKVATFLIPTVPVGQ